MCNQRTHRPNCLVAEPTHPPIISTELHGIAPMLSHGLKVTVLAGGIPFASGGPHWPSGGIVLAQHV